MPRTSAGRQDLDTLKNLHGAARTPKDQPQGRPSRRPPPTLRVPDDARALADAIGELAASPERAAWMGRNARRAFERSYDVRHAQGRWPLIRELAQGEVAAETVGEAAAPVSELQPAFTRRRTDQARR